MSRPLFDRAAVLRHLRAHGSTGIADLFAAVGGDMKRESFSFCMSRLQADDYVENVAGRGVPAVWAVGPVELPDAQSDAQPEQEPHIYPRYCLEVVAPPRQNDHRHSVYTPAQGAPARAGSQDFLQYPSRGHRC